MPNKVEGAHYEPRLSPSPASYRQASPMAMVPVEGSIHVQLHAKLG